MDVVDPKFVFAYIRYSREDLNAPGNLEEKFERARNLCIALAERHGLTIPPANIYQERESGGKLANRPQALAVLDACRSGRCKVLLTPFQDRLLRGDKADEQTIEYALLDGCVTLITSDDVIPFDADYALKHGLIFSIKSAFSRYVLQDLTDKRKKAARVKLTKENRRTCGRAPYGYRTLHRTHDPHGNVLSEARYEIVPEQYEILVEVFRRVRTESVTSLLHDLNARGIPGPRGGPWHFSVLRDLFDNPIYAGHHAHRAETNRDGRTHRLTPDAYVLSEQPGDWPHPITLADWYEIRAKIAGDRYQRSGTTGLLTGILFCREGHAMHAASGGADARRRSYACNCSRNGQPHPGSSITIQRIDDWIREIVARQIEALPVGALPLLPPRRDRADLDNAIRQARADTERAQTALRALIEATAQLLQLGAQALDAQDSLRDVTARRDKARETLARLEQEARAPDMQKARDLVLPLRPHVRRALFGGEDGVVAPLALQRQLVHALIRRIDLLPTLGPQCDQRGAHVEIIPIGQPIIPLPPFPPRRRPSNPR
jgi:hypothetical protein